MVLVPKMAIVALLQDLAMVHPVPDLAMAHPVTVTHVVSVATVVNMVPDPRSVMVQVASLAMERHRAAMVNLLVMAAEVAMASAAMVAAMVVAWAAMAVTVATEDTIESCEIKKTTAKRRF